jgi:hypothetical protein
MFFSFLADAQAPERPLSKDDLTGVELFQRRKELWRITVQEENSA